jgi:serine protease inhibitor
MQFFRVLMIAITIVAMLTPSEAFEPKQLASANTKFGFKLLSILKSDENVFFSPASIGWCLAMVLNGSGGKTKEEIAATLEAKGVNLQDLNTAYEQWKNTWTNVDPKVLVEVANSIWSRRGITVRPEFVETTKKFFGAEIRELDFNDLRSISLINGWVNTKTKGKIAKIVDEISSDSVLFLINAIYFNGKWSKAFETANTKQEQFTNGSGSKKTVSMMHQHGSFLYQENSDFQAIRLPYGSGRMTMDVFLPAQNLSWQKFHSLLTAANCERWMTEFSESDGEIGLPKFRVEYEVTLNDALKRLGMNLAFDPNNADLTPMLQSSGNAYISKVKHKAFAEVNEEGTEAAAVTSGEVRLTSAVMPKKPFRMIVNRPFFFAIRDESTGAILFIGSMTEV